MKVLVHKLDKDAKLPVYAHEGDSCADICSIVDLTIAPRNNNIVPTGLSFGIEYGYECQVRARSGLAAKHGISVLNGIGTVDNNYTGEIKVLLFNTSNEPFIIEKGDRIAQIAIVPISQASFLEVGYIKDTDRGASGFGSTGVK